MVGLATGVLGWRPTDFWLATPHEFGAGLEAWQQANRPAGHVEPMSRERMNALLARDQQPE